MSDLIERAYALRKKIEEIAQDMSDEDAQEYAELFPQWSAEGSYAAGEKVRYGDTLYTVLQDHTAQGNWDPADAPSLFAEVLPGQGGTEIGEWVQPGSTNPYMKGDQVLYNGIVYESLIDNNVWSPSDYPAGWKAVEE